jgi:hypothetical protein
MKNRNAVATATEVAFVRDIANPTAVLLAIEAGHAAVAKANGPMELGAAVAGTWLEIAELEGEETADLITDSVWPLDGVPVELAAAA